MRFSRRSSLVSEAEALSRQLERGAKLRRQHLRLSGRSVPPLIHGFRSEEMQRASGDQVALNIEGIVDGGVAGEETLG